MPDYLRKPAIGTAAREAYDRKVRPKLCSCGSRRFQNKSSNTCIACDASTKERFAAMMPMQKGSKQ